MTAQITAPRSYDPLEWQQGYRSLKEEYDYWIDDIDGQIPPELSGTLFRNGPGMLDVNGVQIQHPFDGDGMICAIGFQDGRRTGGGQNSLSRRVWHPAPRRLAGQCL
jgi:all-trans-8'-apo-beta-carotenal 15,15'-oxygenase